MARSLDEPVVCPVVVGRDGPLEQLRRLVGQAQAGKGQTVLIAGEAGIGKSRLIASTRELATAASWQVLQGSFFEPDRTLPYGGFIDLLRDYRGKSPEDAEAILRRLPVLLRLTPEQSATSVSQQVEVDPAEDKRRLFLAIGQLLRLESEAQPTLIIFEDLHWADDASLDLLVQVAREARDQRLLILLTYRSDEVGSALSRCLGSLERERLAGQIHLAGLSMTDLDRMLRAMLGRPRPVRAEILHAIYELTDGNPFFVEEVVRSIVNEAGPDIWDQGLGDMTPIPRSIDDSVHRRLDSLDAATRRVLELAAVAGRRFDFPLLLRLSQMAEAELLDAMKTLIKAQLVVEQSVDQFSFRHALTRQAVQNSLLLRERRQLHLAVAAAIVDNYAGALEERYGDLAYHAYEGENWQASLEFSQSAGERASHLFSPAAAVEHFSRAIASAYHLPSANALNAHRGRGGAYSTLGDFERALADYELVLTASRSASDRHLEWQVLIDLGELWAGRDYGRTGDYFENALNLARELEDPVMLAASLNRVGNWRVNVERPGEGIELHEQALSIYTTANDAAGRADTLDLLGMANVISGDLIKARAWAEQANEAGTKQTNPVLVTSTLVAMAICGAVHHTDACAPASSLQDAVRECNAALEIAEQIGWRSAVAYSYWNLAFSYGPLGEYGRALKSAGLAIEISREIDHKQWLAASKCASGSLYLDLLDLDSAKSELREALALAEEIGSSFWIGIVTSFLARVYVEQGNLQLATDLLGDSSDQPQFTLALRQMALARAGLLMKRAQYEEAIALLDALSQGQERPIATLMLLRGDALAGLGEFGAAATALNDALTTCQEQERSYLTWRVYASLAALEAKLGNPDRATANAAAAKSLVEELAATIPELALKDRYLAGAIAAIPGARALPRPRTNAGGIGLTAREQEIAAFIAQGLSNRSIAESLVLSERTIETHVANALSKLGFSSRSQLAAWSVEQRLLSGL